MKRTSTGDEKKPMPTDDVIGKYFSDLIGDEKSYDEKSDADFTLTEQQELEVELTTTSRFNAGLDKIKYETSKKTKTVTVSEGEDKVVLTKMEIDEWDKTVKEFGDGDKEYDERELKEWTEKSFQGTLGEILARKALEADGLKTIDLNKVALNFAGLDNISNDPDHPFEQTKLHLAETTASVETYAAHLKQAEVYAIKAVRDLKKHEKKLKSLIEEDKNFKDHKLLNTLLSQLGELEGTGDDDIYGSAAHETVCGGMKFSVPSDIYDKLDAKTKTRFISIGKTVAELKAIKADMSKDFRPTPMKQTEEQKDRDFELNS
jgi:hypothetical protein